MKIKISVLTPKKQAEKTMISNRKALLGYKGSKKVIEEKLLSHDSFYWILEIDEKELEEVTHNCARGELYIKSFYRNLIKTIDRLNKLADKFGKSGEWIRRKLINTFSKKMDNPQMAESIKAMSDEEITQVLNITDREEIKVLMDKELISIEAISQ